MNGEVHGEGGGSPAERFWEEHYRASTRPSNGSPSGALVRFAGPLPEGTALDLGCSQGDDAVWLAGRGWRVVAVDVSGTVLARAAKNAETAGVSDLIAFERHDLASTFPNGRFDLVSALFLHSPVAFPRTRVLQAAARAVAPRPQARPAPKHLAVGRGKANRRDPTKSATRPPSRSRPPRARAPATSTRRGFALPLHTRSRSP